MIKQIAITVVVLTLVLFLSGCFAFLPQSDGFLSLDLEIPQQAKGPGDLPVIVFVGNAAMEDSIKELLWLIDKDSDDLVGLSDKEEDRLVDVAKAVANRGLVKFGGDPFLRTTIPDIPSGSGSFKIPGVPAGRSYFVKVIVFEVGADISNIEKLAEDVKYENRLFTPEQYTTPFAAWTQLQTPIEVEAGKTTQVDITLIPEI